MFQKRHRTDATKNRNSILSKQKNKIIAHIKGASLLEMGMVIGLVSVVSIGGVYSTGNNVKEVFCSAAGHLDKIMGGDGYCLGQPTDASSTLATSGAGFDNGDFLDITWPVGTSGLQSVMVPFQNGTEQSFDMVAATAEGEINACYKMRPEDASVCSPFNGGTSSVNVPKGAQQVGYELTLPANPTLEFDRSVELSFENGGNAFDAWTISQFREPSLDAFFADFDFEDVHFPVGTAGRQYVLIDKDGYYTQNMNLSVLPNGPLNYAACQNTNRYSSPLCDTPSTSTTSIAIRPTDAEVGFLVDLPANIAENVSDTLDIDLTTPGYETYSKDWTINVTREKAPGNFGTAINFDDHTFPPGSRGYVAYQGEDLQGTFSVPLQFTVDGKGQQPIYPCYQQNEGDTRICNTADNSAGGVLSVEVPRNAYSVGYVVNLPTTGYFEPYTRPVDLSVAYAHAPAESQDWSINIGREADIIAFDPVLSDVEENTTIAEDSASKSGMFPFDINGSNTGFTISTNSLSGHAVVPCYRRTGSTSTFCSNDYSTGQSAEFGGGSNTTHVGYRIDPNSLRPTNEALSGSLQIILTSDADPAVQKVYTINYSRVEKTLVFTPTLSGVDEYTTIAEDSASKSGMFAFDLNTNTEFTVSTDATGTGLSIKPCIERKWYGGYACADDYSTEISEEYVYSNRNITDIGYYIDRNSLEPSHEAIDETFYIVLTSREDASITKRFPIRVTRDAGTPE
jgi:Flp pilus assembly pilin Flp